MSKTTKSVSLSVAMAAALALAGGACSSSDTSTSSGDSSGASTSGSAAPSGTSPSEMAMCETDLQLVNVAADEELTGVSDGPIDVATAWADEGKHPDNTVNYDTTLSMAVSSAEIPVDEQFGYSIPVGEPEDLGADDVYLSVSMTSDDTIDAGMTFTDYDTATTDGTAVEADGEINFIAAWIGPNRLLLGDTTIVITEFTDDMVCGEITTTTDTSVQTFVGIEGTFALDRIQALEAAAEEAESSGSGSGSSGSSGSSGTADDGGGSGSSDDETTTSREPT